MDLLELERRIARYETLLSAAAQEELRHRVTEAAHVYPFSAFDYRLMYLQHAGVLSFDSYEDLRSIYVANNPYLGAFAMDSRQFGEEWAVAHVAALDPRLQKAVDADALAGIETVSGAGEVAAGRF